MLNFILSPFLPMPFKYTKGVINALLPIPVMFVGEGFCVIVIIVVVVIVVVVVVVFWV